MISDIKFVSPFPKLFDREWCSESLLSSFGSDEDDSNKPAMSTTGLFSDPLSLGLVNLI